MTVTGDTSAGTPTAGAKLKQLRKLQKLTLKTVSQRVGCSESMLSKIETGRVSPSLQLLARLAEALGTTVAGVFQEEAAVPLFIYREGERPLMQLGAGRPPGKQTMLERLVPAAEGRLLNGNVHVVPPGGGSDGTLSHAGEEVGFVVEGFVELTVDGRVVLLGPGSSFFFASRLPHSYRNIGTTTARIVWVNSPPY